MVSSLKNIHSDPLSLWSGSKDFLRVFTDAANHIPRHRRTRFVEASRLSIENLRGYSFFTHLVDVLGPEDFLPPICMLLVEKIANRVVRQSSEEVQNSLALPSSVLDHNSSILQIRVRITPLQGYPDS
jgi:U3 small nucleolar RNA-associated protein 10